MYQITTLLSIISILFGVLVFTKPQIIAYLVAGFFIIAGISGLFMSLQLKKMWDRFNKQQ